MPTRTRWNLTHYLAAFALFALVTVPVLRHGLGQRAPRPIYKAAEKVQPLPDNPEFPNLILPFGGPITITLKTSRRGTRPRGGHSHLRAGGCRHPPWPGSPRRQGSRGRRGRHYP